MLIQFILELADELFSMVVLRESGLRVRRNEVPLGGFSGQALAAFLRLFEVDVVWLGHCQSWQYQGVLGLLHFLLAHTHQQRVVDLRCLILDVQRHTQFSL